jgi:ATP-dependent RNA helicase SUPV3L1/SUV3
MNATPRLTAVLGPTNTGKTHYAIERMLAHRTGVIGLPLRLLAREVYDRIVAARGPSVVALVTGEERIVPERTAYWVCTVEAMPLEIGADFVAIDEIQLCADPERGHVFTDRLLRARGLHETLLLGSDTMRGAIAALVPGVQFLSRPRLSTLSYAGSRKLSRMPARSAIVGFSVENVYAIAELIRRQKGGCAVVMGALSPRTRNAQVALYQNGDVDYLVATDAIGMGLNLDIHHVAFAATAKFDGRRIRPLYPHEMAQIAGRAGRHTSAGTFGVTGEARPPDPEVIEAIEGHRFMPLRRLAWRNHALDFGTPARLIAALETASDNPWLHRGRDAADLVALRTLAAQPEIAEAVRGPQDVKRLWDVCRIPDFRGQSETDHATLLSRIFGFLRDGGQVPTDWLARAIARIDRTEGDIDALSRRLAFIRTWTYVTQRPGWVDDESHWRAETRAVEDRLSDALHARLTQRFVDRRTSVLLRRLKQKEALLAEVNDKGEVTVEGEFAGRIEGFRFRQDASSSPDAARTLRAAAYEALRPEFHLRSDRFYNAPDTELDYTEQGGLMWGTAAVGKLVRGPDALKPQIEAFVDEEAGPDVAEKVRRRLQHFIDRKVATLFEPLHAISRDEALQGLARGFAFRMVEAMGLIARESVAEDVKALDQDARASLRKHGLRFGQFTVFIPALLKPAPTRLRMLLWSLAQGLEEFPQSPPPGLVTIPNLREIPAIHYLLAGYRPAGARAIRIDMLERLADLVRAKDTRAGFEATPEMLSITGMTLEQFADLMQGLGYRAERGERAKVRPPAPAVAQGLVAADADAADAPDAALTAPTLAEPAAQPEPAAETAAPVSDAAPDDAAAGEAGERESFFTFTWAPRPRGQAPRRGAAGPDGREDRGQPRHRQRAEGRAGGQAAPGPRNREDRPPATAEAGAHAPAPDGQAAEAGASERHDRPRGPRPERGERSERAARPDGQGRPERHGKPDDSGRSERQGRPERGQERRGDGGAERGERQGGRKPAHGRPGDKPAGTPPRQFEARPPRETKIDPDNPFAVLAALRDRL